MDLLDIVRKDSITNQAEHDAQNPEEQDDDRMDAAWKCPPKKPASA